MEPAFDVEARASLARDGVWVRPSAYGEGDPIARTLSKEGRRWAILPGPIAIAAPVRILQGEKDADVPWCHALDLARALMAEDVVFSLIRDGDHRLSRPQDIDRLIAAVEDVGAHVAPDPA